MWTSAIGVEFDLTRDATVDDAVSRALWVFGAIDVLVLNTGGPPPGPAAELTPESMAAAVETLLLAQIRLVSLVLPAMRARGWGRVLAVGSGGVQQPIANLVRSNVARAGLAAYLKTLAGEVAGDGVTVNMVLPGRIDTGRVAEVDAEAAWHRCRLGAERVGGAHPRRPLRHTGGVRGRGRVPVRRSRVVRHGRSGPRRRRANFLLLKEKACG